MKRLEAVFAALANAMLYLATGALLLLTSLVVISAVMRYLVARPFQFTEELVALLYMAMVFLAIPVATVRRAHVSIEVLPRRLTTLLRHPFRILACLAMVAFCAWFTFESWGFMAQSWRFTSRTEQVEILLWPWMAVIPATMGFGAVIAIAQLIRSIPASDAAEEEARPVGDAL